MSDSGKPGSAVLALPASTDKADWSEEEAVLIEAAGLTFTYPDYHELKGQRILAPRAVLAKFRHTAERTGLDPLARQLYCIPRLGRGGVEWTIQTAIDGFRVVAERSKLYAGQTPKQWLTHDGQWVDVWVREIHGQRDDKGKVIAGAHPLAARAGIKRHDWDEPLYAVATWDEYAQTKSNGSLTQMWEQRGPGQLAKCAEALGLRAAFPQDLSGIYTSDEIGDRVLELEEIDPATGEVTGPVSAAQKSRVKRPKGVEGTTTPGTDSEPGDERTASPVADPEFETNTVVTVSTDPDRPREILRPTVSPETFASGVLGEFQGEEATPHPDHSSSQPEGGVCARCGRPEADEDGGLCGPCEDAVQAEIEAEEQGA